jgi:hypothetical protein
MEWVFQANYNVRVGAKNYEPGGEGYYTRYWMLFKYKPEYRIHKDLFRELVRHGVAHIYIPRGPIVVTKERYRSHLFLDYIPGIAKPVFIIDVLTFYDDFKNSYKNLIRPIVFEGKTSNIANFKEMEIRVKQILDSDQEQINKIFEEIKKYHIQQIINTAPSHSRANAASDSDITRQLRINDEREHEK